MQAQYTHQFFISEDDDFINIRGSGTDKGYSSGLHIGYLYQKKHNRFFLDRWMPKAGTDAVNTYGWELHHFIFTPKDLQLSDPVANDYPYSGALYLSHSLRSFNPRRRYGIKSGIIAGVMGPLSLAEPIQKGFHRIIGDEIPKGWIHQLPNDILLNAYLGAEKQLLHAGNWMDLLGGAMIQAGTMRNAISAYSIARAGLLTPYFDGVPGQRGVPRGKHVRWQAYLFARTGIQATAYEALLQGGVVLKKQKPIRARIHHYLTTFDYGAVVAYHNFAVSFTQKAFSPPVKGLQSQETGNITLSFSW